MAAISAEDHGDDIGRHVLCARDSSEALRTEPLHAEKSSPLSYITSTARETRKHLKIWAAGSMSALIEEGLAGSATYSTLPS
jgi:hypothetical protein